MELLKPDFYEYGLHGALGMPGKVSSGWRMGAAHNIT